MSWDDGSHAKVKKVQLTFDDIIYSIQVTYDGTTALQSQLRGSVGPKSAEFILDSDEYITALSAYGKTIGTQEVITALTFTTNKRTLGPYGNKSGFQISAPEATGKQIAGFLGTSGNVLNSIDVHYAPVPTIPPPVKKLEAKGGETGAVWDDGHHDDVKKVYVGQGQDGVAAVKFEYINGSVVVIGIEHGKSTMLGFEEFELETGEYITSMEGTYDKIFGADSAFVTMLIFKTTKNKTYGPFGLEGSTHFEFKQVGFKISGFHGRAGDAINAIGVYLAPLGIIPLTPATPSKKLEAFGSEGGTLWDDGVFDGVRKVSVGQAQDGIGVVQFVYEKGSEVVVGKERGKTTLLGFEELELDYPSEYITAVEGTYYVIFGSESPVITMLRFKTNKQPSIPFGLEAGTPFVLKEEGHKIVGFHGRAGDLLHQFGAHVLPITN
ncbi:PREDICTED: jacalin-related lectin 33-like [Camelina sativa]|uniref:Jacalin-related lectin 33-like n=1 Tax=Camelina sativa TaxID=90675 RepID=A0ABM0XL03_CAMSA|nr:PREDICTED: jacalin-related lectin 33-like [Camelina sativa]XP_010487508.1 PREDICTED: jacalin-related lectin 33-like [Camelina sativa]